MKKESLLQHLLAVYPDFKAEGIGGRYVTYEHIKPYLEVLSRTFHIEEVGKSVLDTPIQSITLGSGPIKILSWSQMHGNESTTTKAIFDLLNLFRSEEHSPNVLKILERCTIKFIPMLNPDGAKKYTRENENGVDLNRDAYNLTQKESKVLRECYKEFGPQICFNLHDQRTIFSAGNTDSPATLSFLAPAMNKERSINKDRKISMQIIAAIHDSLQFVLPGQIGRYDDAFNINCTGDTFQALGVPTILFEAGHFNRDYQREETRKYTAIAILSALLTISDTTYPQYDIEDYLKIPENHKNFCDIILENALIKGQKVEVAVQYKERLENDRIIFEPVVQIINNTVSLFGHRVIDCRGKELQKINGETPIENDIVDAIMLNRDNIPLKIE